MPFPLETKRLILRRFCESDLDVFLSYRSDSMVAMYQGWEAPFARDAGRVFIEEMKSALPGTPGKWFQVAIEKKSSIKLIGDCAFHIMEKDARQAYIGITLSRPFWKKGLAQEACRCLLDYLFGELNLHRVVAECDTENAASFTLLERLGFETRSASARKHLV